MEKYEIPKTPKMPSVLLDPDQGLFELEGNSIPEDAGIFYKPIVEAIENYFKSPQLKTTVNIKLIYFNSASSKWLMNILKLFKFLPKEGQEIGINWYYDENDEDMADMIDDIQSLLGLPIKIHPLEST
ncbi:MAG: DUF1987 domain-containing protein [Bacteroidales bacterium]|nr:DUF1987 domain-containing protein [Bacteroidales bacterium]